MPHLIRTAAVVCGLALALSAQAKPARVAKPPAAPAAPVEIALAHQLGQGAAEGLNRLVERFNHEQKGITVRLVPLAADGKAAPLNLVRRQEMGDFLARKGNLRPLYQIMGQAKASFGAGNLSSDLKAGVTDERGRLVALPVAYSTPVLFYNKAAFRSAGLDPDKPPRTWAEMQETAGKLFDAGSKCPYTTAWPTWIHIDNLSALSSAPVASAKGELAFNGLPQVKHIAMLASWYKARYFRNFGRHNEADSHFANGECAMITTDSSALADFRGLPGMDIGVAPLPHHDDVYGGRQHTLADGASLWIGGGYKPQDYKAAARFIAFLLTPDIQVELARLYGEVPLTQAARGALKTREQADRDSTPELVFASLKGEGASHPLRVSAIGSVRDIVDEELEAVWDDQKPAKAALDTAVVRGNAVLSAKPALKKVLPL